jgi:hypothetical protein
VAVVMICMFGQYTWLGRGYFDGGKVGRPWAPVEKHSHERSAELQIPPLRYASVGMTKGRVALPLKFDDADVNSRSLHFAALRSG